MSTIGKRIKDRRIELGLSADELAEKLGKNRATIYRYEGDEIENLPLSVIVPLATALQVSPAYLMGWSEETEKKETAPVIAGERRELIDLIPYLPDDIVHALLALARQAGQQK